MTSRDVRSLTQRARLAAIALLLVWVGPVTFVQTDTWHLLEFIGTPIEANAMSQVIPAGRALQLEAGTPLKLRMRDGSVLEGRYLGRTLLDSALYEPRFTGRYRTSAYSPFALGETLHVSLRDGRHWTAPFAGYGEQTLLLRGSDGAPYFKVPFEFVSEIHRANGDQVQPGDLAKAFRSGTLPSAEAIVLEDKLPMGNTSERWAHALKLAVEDIESITAELPSGSATGVIVLGVVVAVVLVLVIVAAAANSASSSCSSAATSVGSMADLHLTTRPFDRCRGCFENDPLAVADPWPGDAEPIAVTAAADPIH